MAHTNSNANDGAWVLAEANNVSVLNAAMDEKFRYGKVRSYGQETGYGPTEILLAERNIQTAPFSEDAPLAFIAESDEGYEATNGWTQESTVGRITVVDMESGNTWVALDKGPVKDFKFQGIEWSPYGSSSTKFRLVALLKSGEIWFVDGGIDDKTGASYVVTRMPLAGDPAIKAEHIRTKNKCVWAIDVDGKLYGQGVGSFGKVEVAKTAVKQLSAPVGALGANQHFFYMGDGRILKRTWIGSEVTDVSIETGDEFVHEKLPTSIPVYEYYGASLPSMFAILNQDTTIRIFSREWVPANGTAGAFSGNVPFDREGTLKFYPGSGDPPTPEAPEDGWVEIFDVPGLYLRDPAVRYNRVAMVLRHSNGFLYAGDGGVSWNESIQRFGTSVIQLSLGEVVNSVVVYKGQVITIREDGSLGYWMLTRIVDNQTYPAEPMASMEYYYEPLNDGGPPPVFVKLVSSEGVLAAMDSLGRLWSTRGEGEEFLDFDTIVGPLRCSPVGNPDWRYENIRVVNYNGGIPYPHSQIVGGPYNGDWRAALVVTRDTYVNYVIGWPQYATPGYTLSPGQLEEFNIATGLSGELGFMTMNTLYLSDGSIYQYNLDMRNVDGQIDGRGYQTNFVLVDDTRRYKDVDGDSIAIAVATHTASSGFASRAAPPDDGGTPPGDGGGTPPGDGGTPSGIEPGQDVLMAWGLNGNLITMPWRPTEEKLAPASDMSVYSYRPNAGAGNPELYALSPTAGVYMFNATQYALSRVSVLGNGNLAGGVPPLNDNTKYPINAPVYEFDNFSNYLPRPWEVRRVNDISVSADDLLIYPYYRTTRTSDGTGLICTPATPGKTLPSVVSIDGKIPTAVGSNTISVRGFTISKVGLYGVRGAPQYKYGYATSNNGDYVMWGAARAMPLPGGGGVNRDTLRTLAGQVPPLLTTKDRAWPTSISNITDLNGKSPVRRFYGRLYRPSRGSLGISEGSGSGTAYWRMFMTPVNHSEIVDVCGSSGYAAVVTSGGEVHQCAPDFSGAIVWRKWATVGRFVAVYGAPRCDFKIARRVDGTLWSSRSYTQIGTLDGWGDVAITGFESRSSDDWRVGWAAVRDGKLYAWGHDTLNGIPGTPENTTTPNSETLAPTEIGMGRTWVSVVDGGFAITDDGDMFALGLGSDWAHQYSGTTRDPLNMNVLAQFTGKWKAGRMLNDANGAKSDVVLIRADGALIRSGLGIGVNGFVTSTDRNWTSLPRRDVAVQDSVAAITLNWSAS